MSGGYLKLEGRFGKFARPRGFEQSNLPGGREFDYKICLGAGFDQFLKIHPWITRGAVTLGIG